jgi:hypothetical protein
VQQGRAFNIDLVALIMADYTRIPRISIGFSGEVKRRIRKLMPALNDLKEVCLAGYVPSWTLSRVTINALRRSRHSYKGIYESLTRG